MYFDNFSKVENMKKGEIGNQDLAWGQQTSQFFEPMDRQQATHITEPSTKVFPDHYRF